MIFLKHIHGELEFSALTFVEKYNYFHSTSTVSLKKESVLSLTLFQGHLIHNNLIELIFCRSLNKLVTVRSDGYVCQETRQ